MDYPNALETLEGCAWYIFNFIQIFPSPKNYPNVTRGSVEYSAKVSVKDLEGFSNALARCSKHGIGEWEIFYPLVKVTSTGNCSL